MEKGNLNFWAIISVGVAIVIGIFLSRGDYRHLDGQITALDTKLSGQIAENGRAVAFLTSKVEGIEQRVVNLEPNLESKMDMVIGILTQGMSIVSPSPAEPAPTIGTGEQ